MLTIVNLTISVRSSHAKMHAVNLLSHPEDIDVNPLISVDQNDNGNESFQEPMHDTVVDEINSFECTRSEASSQINDVKHVHISSINSFNYNLFPPTKEILGDISIDVSDDEDIWNPMTFYPTYEEFKDLQKYVMYMEQCGAHTFEGL